MIRFPHAKINLGLTVVDKRPDGYHNLETVFYPIPLREVLEIVPAQEFCFRLSGLKISATVNDNLVVRACQLLKREFPEIAPVEINLLKAIPMGAGLGGGSSDAAGALLILNGLFQLKLTPDRLSSLALELGSDCPFFLQSGACFASGRGEILEPVSVDLSSYSVILVHPETIINTSWAFAHVVPSGRSNDLLKIIQNPVETWKNVLKNDFETPVFNFHPELPVIKESLYGAGALYASMTGSGSTIFGIFRKGELPEFAFHHAAITKIDSWRNH